MQCLADGNCMMGLVCDQSSYTCVTSCSTSMDCGGGAAPYCNTTKKRCVQCLTNTNCMGSGSPFTICDAATGYCVGCLTNKDCTNMMYPTCNQMYHYCM